MTKYRYHQSQQVIIENVIRRVGYTDKKCAVFYVEGKGYFTAPARLVINLSDDRMKIGYRGYGLKSFTRTSTDLTTDTLLQLLAEVLAYMERKQDLLNYSTRISWTDFPTLYEDYDPSSDIPRLRATVPLWAREFTDEKVYLYSERYSTPEQKRTERHRLLLVIGNIGLKFKIKYKTTPGEVLTFSSTNPLEAGSIAHG